MFSNDSAQRYEKGAARSAAPERSTQAVDVSSW